MEISTAVQIIFIISSLFAMGLGYLVITQRVQDAYRFISDIAQIVSNSVKNLDELNKHAESVKKAHDDMAVTLNLLSRRLAEIETEVFRLADKKKSKASTDALIEAQKMAQKLNWGEIVPNLGKGALDDADLE